jgi:hypothetical protein
LLGLTTPEHLLAVFESAPAGSARLVAVSGSQLAEPEHLLVVSGYLVAVSGCPVVVFESWLVVAMFSKVVTSCPVVAE